MSIRVDIPEPLAGKLTEAAKSQGKTPQDMVLEAVASHVDPLVRLNEQMASVQQRLQELGETEDDAVEFFEAVKHELRRKRRMAGK